MELTHHHIDLDAEKRLGRTEFFDVIPRVAKETWVVPFGPVNVNEEVDWRYYKRENHIAIPLVPYLMPTSPELALGFMLQLGLRCAYDFNREVKRMHLSTGHPVNQIINQDSGERFWQFHAGFAVVLAK